MFFKDIIGAEAVKKTLIDSVKRNHVAHAQLFLGNEGSANLAMALAYLTYLNCEAPEETDSCGKCAACVKNLKNIHPDVHFLYPKVTIKNDLSEDKKKETLSKMQSEWRLFLKDGVYGSNLNWSEKLKSENKQLMIWVDDARRLISGLSLKAYEARYKIVLIWLPETLRTEAANALLKIVEEPPAFTVFLFVTTDIEKVLPTILSRTQIVHIPMFEDTEISSYLIKHKSIEKSKADHIALIADGNLQMAIEMLDENTSEENEFFKTWMRMCFKGDFLNLISTSDNFARMGREVQKIVLMYALTIIRQALNCKLVGIENAKLPDNESNFIQGFAKVLNEENVEFIVQEFNQAYYHIERNANPKITFLDLSLRLFKIWN